MGALHRLPGAVADSIWAMIEMCDVRGAGGAYKRQDPWQLLDRLQAAGSLLADQPESKVHLACSETQHNPLSMLPVVGGCAQGAGPRSVLSSALGAWQPVRGQPTRCPLAGAPCLSVGHTTGVTLLIRSVKGSLDHS